MFVTRWWIADMYYMNQGSYKHEPDWQSQADARLEKWLKDKKERERLKQRRNERIAWKAKELKL